MPIAAAAITGAAALGSGIASTIGAKKAQDRQNVANKEMAQYAYSKDLEMWNRQNAYNTPDSQMQRFKDAGLNPNLIYGQGNAGNATQLPKYSAPTIKERTRIPDLSGVLPTYQDAKLKQANIDIATEQKRMLQEKITSESVNRAAQAYKLRIYMPTMLGRHGRMQDKKAAAMNQQWSMNNLRMQGMRKSNTLADYSWQIAKQNLELLEKQNKYYFWNNVGSGIARGATSMAGRYLTGAKGLGKAGKAASKLKNPISKKMSFKDIRKMQRSNSDILPNYNF